MMQSRPGSFERLTRVMFVLDIGIVSSAMLFFSSDPSWTTWVIGSLIIIAGGFRFGTAGAFTAAGAISLAYISIAAYRSETFGFTAEPWRLAFHVSVFILAAYMMSGLLRELDHLRAQREKFVRQAVEAAALRQADRIKSEFLAAMSHDFRSPLTVVRGAVELLLGERPGSLTAAQRELAESAERNVKRLEEFTAQLLEMARLEEGQIALEKEDLDPVALVRDVVADHAVLAKQRKQWISLDVDTDPPHVVADRSRIQQALARQDMTAIEAADGDEALSMIYTDRPDLVVLDLALPRRDGFSVLEQVRQKTDLPIIVLTARGLEEDKIKGLQLGADDYLTKPFSPGELVARIESVLRRSVPRERKSGVVETHDLVLDLAARRVRRGGKDIHFTPTEFNLLAELATHPGEALTHETLRTRARGTEYRYETQYLKVYVGRLREKIEPNPNDPRLIQTVRGVGYRLASPDEA